MKKLLFALMLTLIAVNLAYAGGTTDTEDGKVLWINEVRHPITHLDVIAGPRADGFGRLVRRFGLNPEIFQHFEGVPMNLPVGFDGNVTWGSNNDVVYDYGYINPAASREMPGVGYVFGQTLYHCQVIEDAQGRLQVSVCEGPANGLDESVQVVPGTPSSGAPEGKDTGAGLPDGSETIDYRQFYDSRWRDPQFTGVMNAKYYPALQSGGTMYCQADSGAASPSGEFDAFGGGLPTDEAEAPPTVDDDIPEDATVAGTPEHNQGDVGSDGHYNGPSDQPSNQPQMLSPYHQRLLRNLTRWDGDNSGTISEDEMWADGLGVTSGYGDDDDADGIFNSADLGRMAADTRTNTTSITNLETKVEATKAPSGWWFTLVLLVAIISSVGIGCVAFKFKGAD